MRWELKRETVREMRDSDTLKKKDSGDGEKVAETVTKWQRQRENVQGYLLSFEAEICSS